MERFDRVNRGLLELALKDHRADELTEPLMEVLTAFGIMGALWYGGHQVISGALTPGDFFSFTAAVALLYGPVRQLSRLVNTIQQTTASVERVFELLDTPPAIADRPGAVVLDGFLDAIVFDRVSFRHADSEDLTLRDVVADHRPRRGRRVRRPERRRQVDAHGPRAALPRRQRRAGSRSTATTSATSARPRSAR